MDFARTLLSHGVADLPPNAIERDGSAFETVLASGGSARVVRVEQDGPAAARVSVEEFAPVIRHMLRLDDDLREPAAANLARAGYREDARAQYQWLLKNAKDPSQLETARRELARL